MEIQKQYTPHEGNYRHGGNSMEWIVVHNTGNSASAENEARYAQNDQHESSYHYVLDGDECYQLLNDWDTAWAVGAWRGAVQWIGNSESISIEVVSDGVEFTVAEKDQLRELVGALMAEHGIPADHVVRHYDCHSGRKDCPAFYVDEGAWADLRAYITGGSDSSITFSDGGPSVSAPSGDINIWLQAEDDGGILPAVCNGSDNAGNGIPIRYLAAWVDNGTLDVRANGLPWLTDPSNLEDHEFGCVGDGGDITRLYMYLHAPNADRRVWYRAMVNGEWLAWMKDDIDTGGSGDSFAGNGRDPITRVEAYIGGL